MDILKVYFSALFLICLNLNVTAQYKSFKISAKGDTINRIDKKGYKQGKWVFHKDELRGEPGYEEEGIYKDDMKEKIWRRYTLIGDPVAFENYFHGGKDGLQQYYSPLGELLREENWRGYNPDSPYDTIAIYGTGSNEIIDYKIVKAEQYSVKHGIWKYYEPVTGKLLKTEEWDRNNIVLPDAPKHTEMAATPKSGKKEVMKTPEMLAWEKKNKGKKKFMRTGQVLIQ